MEKDCFQMIWKQSFFNGKEISLHTLFTIAHADGTATNPSIM